LHAAAFKLEHGLGFAVLEQAIGGGVVERQRFVAEAGLVRVALHDQLFGLLEDGERGQPQKVELDQTDGLDVVFVVLAHGGRAAGLLVERTKIGELAGRDQHPAGVHADVARQALELLRQLDQQPHLVFFFDALGQQRLHLDRVLVFVVGGFGLRWVLQRHALARLVGDELADAVAKTVGEIEHAPDVADRGTRRQGAKGGDLAHRCEAVFALDVVDHTVAVGLAEVDVEVGHRHPLGVQEALEQQLVAQRVEVGDLQRVGHQRTGPGAAPRPDRAAVRLGPLDEVGDDQKVARKAHFDDGAELEFEPLLVARLLAQALGRVGVELLQALLQALLRGVAEVVFGAQLLPVHGRDRERRQLRLAEAELQVAAARDFDCLRQRRGQVGKQGRHFGAGLEMLLAREAPGPPGVAQNLAFGDAHARLVGLKIVGRQKLHRVRGHQRQLQLAGQRHGGAQVAFVVGTAGALHLEVEALRKGAGQLLRQRGGGGLITGQQRLPHRPGGGAAEHDQALVVLAQPVPAQHGLVALHRAAPSQRQQLAQVQVAGLVLRQQQQARPGGRPSLRGGTRGRGAQPLQQHLGPEDGLHPDAARRLVELDGPKQVVEVGDGQRGLAVGGGGGGDGVDARGAIDDGKLGVQAQVYKHGHDCRDARPAPPGPPVPLLPTLCHKTATSGGKNAGACLVPGLCQSLEVFPMRHLLLAAVAVVTLAACATPPTATAPATPAPAPAPAAAAPAAAPAAPAAAAAPAAPPAPPQCWNVDTRSFVPVGTRITFGTTNLECRAIRDGRAAQWDTPTAAAAPAAAPAR